MKILHWNVHSWRRPDGSGNQDAVAAVLRQLSPDVVCLVEVDERWGRPIKLQEIAENLDYRWVFVPAFEYRTEGGFGNAILSRTAIRAVQQWQLIPPRIYDGSEPSEPRALALVEVETPLGPFWVGSTHFPRRDLAMRAHASERLLDILQYIKHPAAICGDFNQPPEDWWPASTGVAPSPVLATYPAEAPTERIDYCLLHQLDTNRVQGNVMASDASDHLLLIVNVQLGSELAFNRPDHMTASELRSNRQD